MRVGVDVSGGGGGGGDGTPTPTQIKAALTAALGVGGKGAKIGAILKTGGYSPGDVYAEDRPQGVHDPRVDTQALSATAFAERGELRIAKRALTE